MNLFPVQEAPPFRSLPVLRSIACLMFCGNSFFVVSGRKQTRAATISAGAPRTSMGSGFLSDKCRLQLRCDFSNIFEMLAMICNNNCKKMTMSNSRKSHNVTTDGMNLHISSQKTERFAMKGLSMPKSRATVDDVPID